MSISIKNVDFQVGGKQILSDINIETMGSNFTVLIGPNGAGKSTLLNVLTGSLKGYKGLIELNNKSLSDYSAIELSNMRAVMTQTYDIAFDFSVYDIVRMGTFPYESTLENNEIAQIMNEVMDFVGITSFSDRNFLSLSGGEKQRVQLARVLTQLWYCENDFGCDSDRKNTATDKRYLILDEPLSSLDIFHQYNIMSLCDSLKNRNISVLAVVHDLAIAASFAEQVVLMSEGRVLATGTSQEVLTAENMHLVYKIDAEISQISASSFPSLTVNKNQAMI